MPKKRRNGGKDRHNRGITQNVRCTNCFRCVPKDKAIRRSTVRPIADYAVVKDLQTACAYSEYALPMVYNKVEYCVSCAVHYKLVRSREKNTRKDRAPGLKLRK